MKKKSGNTPCYFRFISTCLSGPELSLCLNWVVNGSDISTCSAPPVQMLDLPPPLLPAHLPSGASELLVLSATLSTFVSS